MSYPALAAELLAVAEAVELTRPVDRAQLVAGPQFGKDCRMLAVGPQAAAPLRRNPLPCGVIRDHGLFLTFVADCYPAPTVGPGKAKLPTAAEVTQWTTEYLADVDALDAAVNGAAFDDRFGDCGDVAIAPLYFQGPQGRAAWATWSLTISDPAAAAV